ncbi:hypothetical protein GCM10027446_28260 [Angustibacter peucedani]
MANTTTDHRPDAVTTRGQTTCRTPPAQMLRQQAHELDLTRLLTTAEVVVGAVVGAVLVTDRVVRRPPGPRAVVTMGPGGWVSMKGGALGVRPGRRFWARPRPVAATTPPPQAPWWARVLSAVPLQALTRPR